MWTIFRGLLTSSQFCFSFTLWLFRCQPSWILSSSTRDQTTAPTLEGDVLALDCLESLGSVHFQNICFSAFFWWDNLYCSDFRFTDTFPALSLLWAQASFFISVITDFLLYCFLYSLLKFPICSLISNVFLQAFVHFYLCIIMSALRIHC